jgi:uncharacterized protein YdaU (DUF1376 family)
MKKPSAYLPLYGHDFFEAIAGHPASVAMGYLRALWHYWSHTSCAGLPDDDEYLRRVCHCEPTEWERLRTIIFDNTYHFRLVEGMWHQPRCQHEYLKSKAAFDKKSKAGRAAAAKRWDAEA